MSLETPDATEDAVLEAPEEQEIPVLEAQAAPGDIELYLEYCDPECVPAGTTIVIMVDDPQVSEVDVTLRGNSNPAPFPQVWDWYVNDGPRLRDRNHPSEVTFTLPIDPSQTEVVYTITARARFRGWGDLSTTIQILLMRASP